MFPPQARYACAHSPHMNPPTQPSRNLKRHSRLLVLVVHDPRRAAPRFTALLLLTRPPYCAPSETTVSLLLLLLLLSLKMSQDQVGGQTSRHRAQPSAHAAPLPGFTGVACLGINGLNCSWGDFGDGMGGRGKIGRSVGVLFTPPGAGRRVSPGGAAADRTQGWDGEGGRLDGVYKSVGTCLSLHRVGLGWKPRGGIQRQDAQAQQGPSALSSEWWARRDTHYLRIFVVAGMRWIMLFREAGLIPRDPP